MNIHLNLNLNPPPGGNLARHVALHRALGSRPGSWQLSTMSITATVENDTIKLPPGVHLPDGTEVSIEPRTPRKTTETPVQTLAERYADLIGITDALPEDMAENHDHYLHGAPKRK